MGKGNMKVELAVVGGGPAGLMVSIEAARAGVKVALFDENEKPGGQLFKQIHKFFGSGAHQAGIRGHDIGNSLLSQSKEAGVKTMLNAVVWGIEPCRLGLAVNGEAKVVGTKKIAVATGASENPLSFPGWTLPGVMGAGAAQTMMNVYRVLPGRRVLMVGSGNVGLIVAYQLMLAGAKVVAVVEASPKIGGYLVHAAKLRRAGVPILVSHTVREATGDNEVEEATIVRLGKEGKPVSGTERTLAVDLICLAVGLRPQAELFWLTGCRFKYLPALGGHVPIHDDNMQTTVEGIYLAGDAAGVEEASTAMEEGRLAGIAIAESLGYLDSKEAAEKKRTIRQRLRDLRRGPFGEMRELAKRQIIESEVS